MSVVSHPAPAPGRPPALAARSAGRVGPMLVPGTGAGRAVALAAAVAAVSMLFVAPAPSYDPWAWLLWGREVTELRLSTPEGPAFKPLPVAVCALLAGLGPTIAPVAWVLLARIAAALALIGAFRLAAELSGGSRAAGLLAAVGVALTGSFLGHAASGLSEPALIALALIGVESARRGRPRVALACAAACTLIRVETWPFLLLAAALAWRRHPSLRTALALVTAIVPVAWFGPELLGSGDLLRSGARARIPNPGQPALAPVPALASLSEAVALVPWPLWLGVGALLARMTRASSARGEASSALWPAALGGAWMALVAVMAQVGFSGEPRYALPGAALISISGAVGIPGLVRGVAPRAPLAAAATVVAFFTIADRGADVDGIPAAQAHHWRLSTSLGEAIDAAGGRRAVLACGTPYVGPYRGTLAAYQLDVAKHLIEPDRPPRAPGVVFRSRLKAGSPPAPAVGAGFTPGAHRGEWQVFSSCAASGS